MRHCSAPYCHLLSFVRNLAQNPLNPASIPPPLHRIMCRIMITANVTCRVNQKNGSAIPEIRQKPSFLIPKHIGKGSTHIMDKIKAKKTNNLNLYTRIYLINRIDCSNVYIILKKKIVSALHVICCTALMDNG